MEHESQWSEKVYPCSSRAGAIAKAGLLILALVFSLAVVGWAQDSATLVGAVTDPTGAAVPSAKVEVSNPTKGFVRELTANSAGEYTAAAIPIGDYVITAEATGFQKLMRSGVKLDVGQTLRLDLQLTLGATTQEISISGTVSRVETENAMVSDMVTGNQIQDLNLNGRNYQALTILTPGGAADNSFDPSHLGHNAQATISFNGTRSYYNNFEVDGAQNNDTTSGGPSPDTFPALDSIAEFRVSTSNYGADVGMRAGANIQVVTKSGTKDFHGDAYEFVRNDAMDSNDWFANRTIAPPGGNAPKTPLKWNVFGYTFGGPFYIPDHYNVDKSKTFFFWSESWARYREGTVISNGAPTLRMRQGDFSECDAKSANFNPVVASNCALPTNPATGLPFAGDVVPVDPNAADLMNAYVPLPNNGVDGYISAPSTPTNWRQEQIRVDQNISEKTTVFVRYTQDSWGQDLIPNLWSSSVYDTIASPWKVPAKNAVLHLTHTFKPDLMNEFILGYGNDPHIINVTAGPGSVAKSILRPSDWSVVPLFGANSSQNILPAINVSGGLPFSFDEDAATDNGYYSSLATVTLKDNVVYTHGKHTFKAGIFGLNYRGYSIQNGTDPQGSFTWNGGGSVTSGNGLADMYLGRIQSYTEGSPYNYLTGVATGGLGEGYEHFRQWEPYVQDDWKVGKRLTLNIGARYSWNTMYYDSNKDPPIDTSFVPSLYSAAKAPQININNQLVPGSGQIYTTPGNGLVVCTLGGIPQGCSYPDRATLAPRFGFAVDPKGDGKTSVRGGFGVYHDLNALQEVSVEQVDGGPPAVLAPVATNIVGYQNLVPGPLSPSNFSAFPERAAIPMVMQYNVTVQHELTGNNFLSLAWVGTLGRHLGRSRNLNQIPDGAGIDTAPALAGFAGTDSFNPSNTTPMCNGSGACDVQRILINEQQPATFFQHYQGDGNINWLEYSSVSDYESLQLNYRHIVGHGITFQGAYTYSHAIDTATGYDANYGIDDSNLSRWRGTGDNNRTNVLVMNYVYDVPFFRHASSSFLRTGLGGWKVSGITSFWTGQPVDANSNSVNITCGVTGFNDGVGRGMSCNTLGPLKIQKGTVNDTQFGPTPTWFNPGVLQQPYQSQYYSDGESGMFGYMGRNDLTGPGRNNFDIALLKDFQMPWFSGEHSSMQFRLETYNTFNHPQWKTIQANCGGETPFGAPCSGNANNYGNSEVTGAYRPRLVQLGLKFTF